MESIGTLLQGKRILQIQKPTKPKQMKLFVGENNYHDAKRFADKYKVSVYFILKQAKKFGIRKILQMDSWLSDYPVKTNYYGLIVWKLKQGVR